MQASAAWHDGRTAARHALTLRLGEEALEGFDADSSRLLRWPLAALHTTSATLDGPELLLGCDGEPGRIVVADPAFRAALLRRAPWLRPARAAARRLLWLVPAGALGIAALVLALSYAPPLLAPLLPETLAARLGNGLVLELADGAPRCIEPRGEAALERLVEPLRRAAAAEGGRPPPLGVEVIDLPEANGFAVPGGRLVLTAGLLRRARSPAEIAGVVAHEIGHVVERHPEQSLVRILGITGLTQLLTMGADNVGSALAQGGALLATLAYSREAERAADAHAIGILAAAGVPSAPLGTFLARLGRSRDGGGLADLLATHPGSIERLQVLLDAPPVERPRPLLDDEEWQALVRICDRHGPLAGPG